MVQLNVSIFIKNLGYQYCPNEVHVHSTSIVSTCCLSHNEYFTKIYKLTIACYVLQNRTLNTLYYQFVKQLQILFLVNYKPVSDMWMLQTGKECNHEKSGPE